MKKVVVAIATIVHSVRDTTTRCQAPPHTMQNQLEAPKYNKDLCISMVYNSTQLGYKGGGIIS